MIRYTVLFLILRGAFCFPQNAIEGILPRGIPVIYKISEDRRAGIEELLSATLRPQVAKTERKSSLQINESIVTTAQVKKDDKKLDRVITYLQGLQREVKELKEEITVLQKQATNKSSTPEKCAKGVDRKIRHQFVPQFCGNDTKARKYFYLIDSSYGTWDKEGFCRVFSQDSVESTFYKLSVNLFNVDGPDGINSGFPGIAFNVQDQNNFDFVYLRLHRPLSCYRTGYMQKGVLRWSGSRSGTCPEGPPKGRTWFKLEVFVRDTEATVRVNSIKVKDFKPHFPPTGKGGVIVAAGQVNKVRFKKFNVTIIKPLPFTFLSCSSHHHLDRGYVTLDARHGEWPEDGFCRAISKRFIPDENYAVSVSLYNQRAYMGVDSGVIGLIFNVQDNYNFDVVYVRPHSKGGCFTTGFVQNGGLMWVNSQVGSCPGGPPKGGKWFNLTVHVRKSHITVSLDSKHLTSTQAHFPSTGRGGVIVGNGLMNVASFRDFKIFPVEPLPFDFIDCTSKSRNSQFYYVLDASHGDWPKDTFCRAIHKKTVPGENYVISVKLFNQGPWRGEKSNYAGVLFNAKDNNNYDFIYFKPHSQSCFMSGYVLNGELQWSGANDGFCSNGSPKIGIWYRIEVSVRGGQVMVELDGKHIVSYQSHFPPYGKGGVVVANGYRNIITFREYSCYPTNSLPFIIKSCGEGTRRTNGSFVLDASLDKSRGHCTALSRTVVKDFPASTKYVVESRVYNVNSRLGSEWGTLGIMYNVVDDNNYDYVVLNLHSRHNCYQFGVISNGISKDSKHDFGSCPHGVPQKEGWFQMRIEVFKKRKVTLIVDGRQIAKGVFTLDWKPSSGIAVENGNRNVVMFREFLQQVA